MDELVGKDEVVIMTTRLAERMGVEHIGKDNDPYRAGAKYALDAIAEQVIRMPAKTLVPTSFEASMTDEEVKEFVRRFRIFSNQINEIVEELVAKNSKFLKQ